MKVIVEVKEREGGGGSIAAGVCMKLRTLEFIQVFEIFNGGEMKVDVKKQC